MANYLPVLLVSVTAGMPDDAALQPLPRGQVDYLSHDWAEEDVWRSWRSMTKQKHEIANGVRLENASWRTWMKQRNKLKTISPETLNWLKDSDVTWLYGPLHTAVDWSPTPKPAISPPAAQQSKDDSSAPSSKNTTASNSLSSPSSSTNLNHLNQPVSRYGIPPHEASAKKPILKHRSIAEMLTSALPPTPVWAEETSDFADDHHGRGHETSSESHSAQERLEAHSSERGGRPPVFHTKSDTNILTRFGRGGTPKKARISPPRAPDAAANYDPSELSLQAYHASLSASQRTGASNNLADLMLNAKSPMGASNDPHEKNVVSLDAESSGASTYDLASSGRADSDASVVSPAASLPPQKKHISFNAIVEQCIAIDGDTASSSPSVQGQSWTSYDDDGYVEDTEDGLYEDVGAGAVSESEDDSMADVEDDDEVIEMKPPSRRSSFTGQQDYQTAHETLQQTVADDSIPARLQRPKVRRSSTGSCKAGRSSHNGSAGSSSGSGSNSGRSSEMSRSRSNATLDREHVTIAPIAPTILKTGGAEDNEDGVIYMGGSPYSSYGAGHAGVHGSGTFLVSRGSTGGGLYDSPSGFAYGYGGYGYGENVSAGRNDAYEHFERGTEAGELVYQSPNGNVYPWVEGDAARFRSQTEFGYGGSPPHGYGPSPRQRSPLRRVSSSDAANLSSTNGVTQFAPDQLVKGSSSEIFGVGPEFDYFDTVEDAHGGADNGDGQANADEERQLEVHGNNVRIFTTNSSDGAEHSPQSLESALPRERTPSPDVPPKVNPRIASLKYESGCRPPSPSPPSPSASDIAGTLVSSPIPTPAIPTPAISLFHQDDYARMRSPPESPILHAGLLSPEMSPRGRSICTSPVSGSATSSSVMRSESLSGSESRSESRGRSRTRNSSIGSSPEQGEPERGRSRSRSAHSGAAHSPLSDNGSPQMRYPPIAVSGIGMGLGIGGGFGVPHSGREVRDGRGVQLYRKTSEEVLGRHDGSSAQSSRGRNREGKRISESLSPPFVSSSAPGRNSTLSPPGNTFRAVPSSVQKSYSSSALDGVHSAESHPQHALDRNALRSADPTIESPQSISPRTCPPSGMRSSNHESSDNAVVYSFSASPPRLPVSSTAVVPPSIPEEDEKHALRTTDSEKSPTITLPSSGSPTIGTFPAVNSEATHKESSSSNVSSQSADEGSGKTFANRTAGLMSSARTLLGTIWNAQS